MIDIEKATKNQLLAEYEAMEEIWGMYSCDSLGYYIEALHKRIVELGGWPPR
jgi:hypothetical protein